MIGESSGVDTLFNNERIYRESQVEKEQAPVSVSEESADQTVSDVARFSAEAVALSREVVAAGESNEQDATQPEGRGQEGVRPDGVLPFRAVA